MEESITNWIAKTTLVLISRFSIWLSVFLLGIRFYNLRVYGIEKGFWNQAFEIFSSITFWVTWGQCISYLLLCGNSKLSCFKNNDLLFLTVLWAGRTQLRASSVLRGTFCLPAFFILEQKNNAKICFSEHFFKWDNALKVISTMPGPLLELSKWWLVFFYPPVVKTFQMSLMQSGWHVKSLSIDTCLAHVFDVTKIFLKFSN